MIDQRELEISHKHVHLLLNILDLQTGNLSSLNASPLRAQTRWAAFCFRCKLTSEPEICLRGDQKPPTLCPNPTLNTPTAQVYHPVKTGCDDDDEDDEATKILNQLKYKTPDILKTLAAKNDFTAVLICYF